MKWKKCKSVFNEQERYKLVRAIKWVDEVVENVPYETKLETLDKYGCDVCMHGGKISLVPSMPPDDIVFDQHGQDLYAPFKKCDRYREFQRTEGVSTTDILERIISAYLATSKIVRDSISNARIISPYTCGNTKYYLNTMRISQFSGGAVNLEPKPSDKIVYCPGNFDLFHIGHVDFLEQASKLGDYLIVGLYADKVAHFEADKMGTVLRLEERMLSVLACR
ncbi:Ethanolamine-phosphate cytidylyltransferase, partial [Cichlidogyrus casuarinus]